MILICKHCHHEWEYKGNKGYATCPNCHYKVNVSTSMGKSKLKVSSYLELRMNNLEAQVREIQRYLKLEMPEDREEGRLIRCGKCGYEWYYKGFKEIARCNNCNARIKVNKSLVKM